MPDHESKMTDMVNLCSPDEEKSCFACCPPIRPAHYEHIQYQQIVERFLRENRKLFHESGKTIKPITGFNCWALGYLDSDYKRVGCMLHPAQNNGEDLRYRIDYGDKCRRETCPEEKTFSSLKIKEKHFWLHLSDGLDSFSYSSRAVNPLFKMMGWGQYLLQLIAAEEANNTFLWDIFLQDYPFFSTQLAPRANAYLVNELVRRKGVHILRTENFKSEFESFALWIPQKLRQEVDIHINDPFVHQLDLDPYFSSFLRLSAEITRLNQDSALHLKKIVDNKLSCF